MDGIELRQTLLETLVTSLNKSVADRVDTHSSPHHNYLTGRIETLRTLLEFVMNIQIDSPVEEQQGPKKGCEECGGECQGHPDSGEEDDSEEKEEGEAK